MGLSEKMKCYNEVKVDGMEAFFIYLKCFGYPCQCSDIIPRFGRYIPQLSMISNLVANFIYENHKQHLENLGQNLLSPLDLQLFAEKIHVKGAPLHNC